MKRFSVPASLFFLTALLLFPLDDADASFTGDPIPNTYNTYIVGDFMQLSQNSSGTNYLHTGVDLYSDIGKPVYAPIPSGIMARVVAIGSDAVALESGDRQWGDYEYCILGHIDVNSSITLGSWVNNSTLIGTINSLKHLHLSLFLTSSEGYSITDAFNPRLMRFKNAPWNQDTTAPDFNSDREIIVHYDEWNNKLSWQFWAYDPSHSMPNVYHSIYGAWLLINGRLKDDFYFEKFVGKDQNSHPTWEEFYFDFTPAHHPNNPNVLNYKLSWTPDEGVSVWQLGVNDPYGNRKDSDPYNPPAANSGLQMGGEIINGQVFLKWRISTLNNIEGFKLYWTDSERGGFTEINTDPVFTVDGQYEYELVEALPSNWSTVWWRVNAVGNGGEEYVLSSRDSNRISAPRILNVTFPNPVRTGDVRFNIALNRADKLNAEIYDVSGRKIKTLYSGNAGAGNLPLTWDGTDNNGSNVSSGIYLVKVIAGNEAMAGKITLIK